MTPEQAAREFVKQTRDESGPAHDPHSLLVGFLAGAAWEREQAASFAEGCKIGIPGGRWDKGFDRACEVIAAAIRARSQAATEGRGEG